MEFKKLFFCSLSVFLFTSLCLGGSLEPTAPPSSGGTMKTLDEVEPRIPITSWPFDINQPGSYYLTNNLLIETFINGITIDANDVTIDLMGHKIELGQHFLSGEYYGIKINGKKNIKIHNGTIRGFNTFGIFGEGSEMEGVEISSMRIIGNESGGIYLEGSNYKIKDCFIADNNSHGIYCRHLENLFIENCTVTNNNGTGINGGGSTNSVIKNCIVDDNAGIGITLRDNSKFKDNIVKNNSGAGISGSDNCIFSGNSVYSNSGAGISCDDGNTIISNSVYANSGFGIWCDEGNVLKNNSARNNNVGIKALNGSSIIHNSVRGNNGDGIYAGYACTVTGNTAYSNGDYGINLGRYNLVDQNTAYNNDLNEGGTGNMDDPLGCVFGKNVAP